MSLLFCNKGLIDLRAIRTMGWSAKETDSPIGMFGTGSRYAIATLLRTDHNVTLFRGLDRYTFGLLKVSARANKEFDLVTMTGPDSKVEELAFTSQLGKTWLPWMSFRELYSNTIDEKGDTTRIEEDASSYSPKSDETAFIIEGKEIEIAWLERDTIFLDPHRTPIAITDKLEVYQGASKYAYYRGIRIATLLRESLYTYNLRTVIWGITEDRTLTNMADLEMAFCCAAAEAKDETFLRKVLLAPSGSFEQASYPWTYTPSDLFMSTFEDIQQNGHMGSLVPFGTAIYLAVKKSLPLPATTPLTKVQQKQLDKAIAFCEKAGWTVKEYPIVVVAAVQGNTLAMVNDGRIVLTQRLFDMGIKEVVNALFEEWCHIKTGFYDCTRDFQTHLMRQLVNAKEELLEEAL